MHAQTWTSYSTVYRFGSLSIYYRGISSSRLGSVRTGPNYQCSWTGPFVAGPVVLSRSAFTNILTYLHVPVWNGTVTQCIQHLNKLTAHKHNTQLRDGAPPFPNWRRSRGRPPITWLHQICSDCGLSAGDTLNCAQDRAAWRTYATASSALR